MRTLTRPGSRVKVHTAPQPAWARLGVAFTLAILLYALWVSWNQPLLDMHGFRQTQTALSAYWMTRGGPLLLYETPLFGPDWLLPFEFPVYQWLVAAIAGSGLPISLDQSGRMVSLAALVACIWPLRVSLRLFGASPEMVAIACILFLAAPIHVFWGRAVMIESLALLFAMGFTATIQTMTLRRDFSLVFIATLLSTAAALVKITTFFSFAVLAGLVVASAIVTDIRRRNLRKAVELALAAAAPILLAMAALLYLLAASDAAKESSPLTAWLSSAQLGGWNYGAAEQRLSADFWLNTVFKRIVPDILGYAAWFMPFFLVLSMLSRDTRGMAAFCISALMLFMLPMLVFTNLHQVHNYYQVANAVFLTVFAAALIDYSTRGRSPWLAALFTFACVIAMAAHSWLHFLPAASQDGSSDPSIEIAQVLRSEVARDDVIVIAGLDWSAAVPYYAQRRAVMLRSENDVAFIPDSLPTRERPNGARVGAFVQCSVETDGFRKLEARLGPDPRRIDVGGCIIYLRAPAPP